MQPPPPPGLGPKPQGGTPAAAQTRDRQHSDTPRPATGGSQKRPYWRGKDKGTPQQQHQRGGQNQPQQTPGMVTPRRRHRGSSRFLMAAHRPHPTAVHPAGASTPGRGRGGRGAGRHSGRGGASTPQAMPRSRQPPPPGSWAGCGSSSYGMPPGGGGTPMHRASSSSSRGSSGRGSKSYYSEHLAGQLLQQGLKGGALFRCTFRTNPSDRSQGYCTLPGLPTDVFVRVSKEMQRRAQRQAQRRAWGRSWFAHLRRAAAAASRCQPSLPSCLPSLAVTSAGPEAAEPSSGGR